MAARAACSMEVAELRSRTTGELMAKDARAEGFLLNASTDSYCDLSPDLDGPMHKRRICQSVNKSVQISG